VPDPQFGDVGPPTVPVARTAPSPGRWARWAQRLRDDVLDGERQRVAEELNDVVVRRLYRLGLSLESVLGLNPDLEATLRPLIRETDEVIRATRDVALGAPRPRPAGDEIGDVSPSWGRGRARRR
jgi:hypothetical protein